MKGKCPHCNDGCNKCNDGFIQIGFATGNLYTIHCLDCGEDNGGNISKEFPKEDSGECVWCGGKTEWLLIGKME